MPVNLRHISAAIEAVRMHAPGRSISFKCIVHMYTGLGLIFISHNIPPQNGEAICDARALPSIKWHIWEIVLAITAHPDFLHGGKMRARLFALIFNRKIFWKVYISIAQLCAFVLISKNESLRTATTEKFSCNFFCAALLFILKRKFYISW